MILYTPEEFANLTEERKYAAYHYSIAHAAYMNSTLSHIYNFYDPQEGDSMELVMEDIGRMYEFLGAFLDEEELI